MDTTKNTRADDLKWFRTNFPVPRGEWVLQGHADACELWGHATWIVDDVDKGICPRCGEVTR